MHALIINRGDSKWTPEGHQVQGFSMYQRALGKTLGLTIHQVVAETLEEIESAIRSHPSDIAFVMVSWREEPDAVVALFRRLESLSPRPRLIFLDYYAAASSPFLGVLPYVDAYFKRQIYRDTSLYFEDFEGGNLLTDYVAKSLDIPLDGWHFGSKPDPAFLHKMVHGWNLGVVPQYRRLLRLTAAMPLAWANRPFAVNCRLGLAGNMQLSKEWYVGYREHWRNALDPLRQERRCTGSSRIRLRYYFAEMILSRIGVSPFGWGEICFRDYEIVASGALLIKPSMSHLKTSPDLFVEGQTYVPCAWDGSDIVELCNYYLDNPAEANRIVANGQKALSDYFEKDGFVEDVRRIVEVAGLRLPGGSSIPSRRVPVMA